MYGGWVVADERHLIISGAFGIYHKETFVCGGRLPL